MSTGELEMKDISFFNSISDIGNDAIYEGVHIAKFMKLLAKE